MAEGKWIDGLSTEMPVAEAARLVLAARFDVVRTHLPLAVESPYADIEHVHQLRVGTRRARAALQIFRECLSKKDLKDAKSVLRSLRRASGAARDWDVFIQSLETAAPLKAAGGKATHDFLLGYALGERCAAQTKLIEAAQKSGPDLLELSALLPEQVGDSPIESFGDLAEADLRLGIEEFSLAVDADPTEAADLHKLRILGKHLRYSIEIFASCFTPSLKQQLYPAVEALQEHLGELQDAAVGIERLEGLRDMARQAIPREWPRMRTGITKLIQGLRAKLRTGRRKFQTWRKSWEKLVAEYPLELVEETTA